MRSPIISESPFAVARSPVAWVRAAEGPYGHLARSITHLGRVERDAEAEGGTATLQFVFSAVLARSACKFRLGASNGRGNQAWKKLSSSDQDGMDLAPGRLASQVGDFMGQLAAQLQGHRKCSFPATESPQTRFLTITYK
jgi:hypothetical protein